MPRFFSLTSIVFRWSSHLVGVFIGTIMLIFKKCYHCGFVHHLKSGKVKHSALPLLSRIAYVILGLFCLHMNSRITFSSSIRSVPGILIRTASNNSFRSMLFWLYWFISPGAADIGKETNIQISKAHRKLYTKLKGWEGLEWNVSSCERYNFQPFFMHPAQLFLKLIEK